MKRVWAIIAVVVIGSLVVGAGYAGFASNKPPAAPPAEPVTIPVIACTVQQTVTAPGSLINTRTTQVEMPLAGQLAEVLVRAGEAVSAGQTLARVAHPETYAAAVAAAELELAQAQQALSDLQAIAPLKAAQAQLAYAQAQQDLTKAQTALTALMSPDVAYYRQQVNRAQDNLDIALKNANLTDLTSAVTQAKEAVADASDALNDARALDAAYPGVFAEQVKQAQRAYDSAVENLQNITLRDEQTQITNANSIEDAQTELAAAQRHLAGAQAMPNTAQVTLAEAQVAVKQALVAQAQAEWEALQKGPSALDVSAAQARVDKANTALTEAQQALAQVDIKAPFAGIILEVNAQTGETTPASTALFTLADPQAVEVETTVIEEDVPYVTAQQPAEIYFDALPGDIITGTVARIVPQRVPGDRPLYHVYLSLDHVPPALFEGMSADASIVIAERADVLCLPRALAQASADGSAIVEVWVTDHTEKRAITVGLRGDTYVEILSGLQAGEAVVAR